MTKVNLTARRKARRCALQAIYQWQLTESPVAEIEAQFLADTHVKKIDFEYFQELLHTIPKGVNTWDKYMAEFLDRPIEKLDPIELAILRIGTYELVKRLDVPYRVVINEALELAKMFGANDSYKYVNGILDQIARRVRAIERH